jgi:hypothetical protein
MAGGCAFAALAQVDPERRDLVELGYNQALEGRTPISGYAFYYRNQPGFIETNVTLRLAVAPVYLDSEVAFLNALGHHTDLAFGVAGGGYADSYYEMRHGKYVREESFTGHAAEGSSSVYHLFNPSQQIPLNGVLRISSHSSFFERDSTDANFVLPDNYQALHVRTGLRWGGVEPVLAPSMAMELSAWYEGILRDQSDYYGYNSDRKLESSAQLFWARGLLVYSFCNSNQMASASVTAGTSINADRLSAYRLGGDLPLCSEFPLILPGYAYQEISAERFVALTLQYSIALDPAKRWSLAPIASVACVDYLPGFEQGDNVNSGVGLGIGYRSPSGIWTWRVEYGYGFEAERTHGRGAQSIGLLCQIDLGAYKSGKTYYDQSSPAKSRGLFRLLLP